MTENDRFSLRNVVTSPGWKVALDLMEGQCEKAEKELLRAPVSDATVVVARHNTAQAYARFFEDFQRSVIQELGQEVIVEKELTPLEIIERQVNQ